MEFFEYKFIDFLIMVFDIFENLYLYIKPFIECVSDLLGIILFVLYIKSSSFKDFKNKLWKIKQSRTEPIELIPNFNFYKDVDKIEKDFLELISRYEERYNDLLRRNGIKGDIFSNNATLKMKINFLTLEYKYLRIKEKDKDCLDVNIHKKIKRVEKIIEDIQRNTIYYD